MSVTMRHPPPSGSSFSLCELCVMGWTGSQNEDNTGHVLIKGFPPSLLPGELCYFGMGELVNDGYWCLQIHLIQTMQKDIGPSQG